MSSELAMARLTIKTARQVQKGATGLAVVLGKENSQKLAAWWLAIGETIRKHAAELDTDVEGFDTFLDAAEACFDAARAWLDAAEKLDGSDDTGQA